jgi:hypothetical protein
MELIHLPTGQRHNLPTLWEAALHDYPDIYIRAELPEYWRVEGYDKGWEWFENNLGRIPFAIEYDWISNCDGNKKGINAWDSACKHMMHIDQISRAEFEYHIYNHWKREQGKAREYDSPIINELLAEADLDGLNALKKKAKELGYTLVKEDPSEWVVGRNRYFYEDDYLRIKDIEDGEYVYIQEDDLDEVIQKIQSIRNS